MSGGYRELVRSRHDMSDFKSVLNEAALGIASESGEFAQCVRKRLYENSSLNAGEMILELGDIIHYYHLAILAMQKKYNVSAKTIQLINEVKCFARDRGFYDIFQDGIMAIDFEHMSDDMIMQYLDAIMQEINHRIEFGNK